MAFARVEAIRSLVRTQEKVLAPATIIMMPPVERMEPDRQENSFLKSISL